MEIVKHGNIDTFLKDTQIYLEENESLNNLMLGICFRIKDKPDYYSDVYLATIKDKEEMILAAVMTPPNKLVLYSNKSDIDEAFNLLLADIKSRKIFFPGILGSKSLVEKAVGILEKHSNYKMKIDMNMRVYKLTEVNHELIGNGKLRLADFDDLEFITEGIYEFEVDAGINKYPDKDKCYEGANNRIKAREIYIWEVDGQPVSMAGKSRPTNNGVVVTLVYTPSELRNKGYAGSCVASLSQELLDSGYKFCSLFTDLMNPTSNSIYMKIGYKPIGDFDSYILES